MPLSPQVVLDELAEEFLLCARYGETEELSGFPAELVPTLVLKSDPFTGNTALMLASANGHLEIVKLIFEWACENKTILANMQNQTGSTALHWAALTGQIEVTELLLANGADANIKNSFGDRPFDEAIKRRAKPEILEILAKSTNFNDDAEFAKVEGGKVLMDDDEEEDDNQMQ